MADIVDIEPTTYTTDDTPATASTLGFTSGRAAFGEAIVMAHSDDGNKAAWKFSFLAYRQGDDITIINQLLGLVTSKTTGALLWDAYLDNGDGVVELKVKGANNKNINWHVELLWGRALAPAS